MRFLSFLFHRIFNPILWTNTSESLYRVLTQHIKKTDLILEIGSGTGHVSYTLAKQGYNVALNEIRKECLEETKRVFNQHNVRATYVPGDLFRLHKKFDFLWNSGLIQCFSDKDKHKLIKKLATLTPKVLLFYPDIDHPQKIRGTNRKKIPGVDDAVEYPIQRIPSIMYSYFKKLSFGTMDAKEIGLPYTMFWVYGDNS